MVDVYKKKLKIILCLSNRQLRVVETNSVTHRIAKSGTHSFANNGTHTITNRETQRIDNSGHTR